jgi:hypothetical protein
MLKPQPMSRKKLTLLLVVLLFFLSATIFLLYKNFLVKKRYFRETFQFGRDSISERILEKEFAPFSKLINDLFQREDFKFLKIHGQLPVEKGETGRSNPFMPF